jgi:hypothetical protein
MKRLIISILTILTCSTVFAVTDDGSKGAFVAGSGDQAGFPVREVVISPNPVHNSWFTVELGSGFISEIRILNITGTVVYQRKPDSRTSIYKVYTGKLPDGIYFLKITGSDLVSKTYKLMIINQP